MEGHPTVPKATVSDFVTIFVAIELSRKSWLVAATSSDTEKISLRCFVLRGGIRRVPASPSSGGCRG